MNLPETVKGALFARYSRYPGTLRRLFLDEFADSLPEAAGAAGTAEEGTRAAELYERIFVGYGDDSVAQLGGAHVACEWVSNVLTKMLQRPRLAAYLEQSTRYIAYDAPMPGGGYRYYRDAGARTGVRGGDGRAVRPYAEALPRVRGWVEETFPRARGRVARRARARGRGQGAGPAARPAARGVAVAHGHLRDRPGLRAAHPAPDRPPAARGARLRRADPRGDQGGDAELRLARRAPRPRRRVGRPPRARRAAAERWAARLGLDRAEGPTTAPRCACCTSTATRTACWPPCCSRPRRTARRRRAGGPRARRDERARAARRPRGRAPQPPPPPRPRLRGAALPLRDRLRLRRLPRPAAPPDADRAVAGADARPRRRGARGGRRRRRGDAYAARAGALARRVRAARRRRAWPPPRRTRSASATASATCSTSTRARRCT